MDDLLPDFLSETAEGLAALDDALLRLERLGDDPATVSEVFRLMHTIKGTCGFLGLGRLERVAHAAESVLGQVRDGTLGVSPGLVTLILNALDRIKLITVALAKDGVEPVGEDGLLIEALLGLAAGVPADEPIGAPADEPASGPADEPVDEPVAAGALVAAPVERGQAPDAAAQTIRVAVDVLENLMTLASELVLTRNQLLQLARTHEAAAFATPLERLSHITSDLQEGVMKTRMQPIGNAWSKLPRLVRDLSRELGKTVELIQTGQDTELDRQVLELIRDPLTHMVRNSIDHGLESAELRRAAGKPEQGHITLTASHQGGHVVLGVADDGRGLDTTRIRGKILSRGLAEPAAVAAMTAAELHQFIFHPGFSTADQVTAISGRGVGMDVVKTNIERINGTVDVESRPGQGTRFAIKIPLTLAIVSALIVEAAGERFAIPQINVIELVHARPAGLEQATPGITIEHLDGTPVLRLRDRLLPLVALRELLRLEPAADATAAGSYIVVASVGSTSLGIIVDRVFDTEEIVVKPVPPILRHITMFSGNTILGDGAVIMILDPNGLARAAGLGGGDAPAPAVQPPIAQSDEHVAILLFRAGDAAPKAVPLGLVARLEEIATDKIERSGGRPVVQYRGKLMPIVPIADPTGDGRFVASGRSSHPVLVFTEQGRSLGLLADEIVDVVSDRLRIELGSGSPGVLGTAVIAGQATDVIDTAWWLAQAGEDWFGRTARPVQRPRVLVVEDSDFFRQMLIPTLSAAGFDVTACDSGEQALAVLGAGRSFEAVVSDIEMPGIDGLALVRRIRAEPAWASLPVIALSGRTSPADLIASRTAGFTDHIPKFDRDLLLASLKRALSGTTLAAALTEAAA